MLPSVQQKRQQLAAENQRSAVVAIALADLYLHGNYADYFSIAAYRELSTGEKLEVGELACTYCFHAPDAARAVTQGVYGRGYYCFMSR